MYTIQVVLLLKSSDRIAHDICNTFDDSDEKPKIQFKLILKKWFNLILSLRRMI